jgi:CheY-like chemotaxis protein/anti-sigma regulatory factor (Ser/Thr protein kinase)
MTRILIVDDSPVDRQMAGRLLAQRAVAPDLENPVPLTPVYAGNGQEALDRMDTEEVDAVVTDLQMPGMDGLELVVQVRERHPLVPVVLMTAHGSEETAIKALRKGATNYVAKRKLAKELVATVKSVLEIARADRGQQEFLRCLVQTEARYEIDNDLRAIPALLEQLEIGVTRMQLCDRTGWMRIAVALREAVVNAIYHGNLELTSQLREDDEAAFDRLAEQRLTEAVFAGRRVHVTARETRNEVTYVLRDEGRGFDPTTLPDPTNPANLERRTGRGLFLIRTFMDEVRHNAAGNEITLVKRRER